MPLPTPEPPLDWPAHTVEKIGGTSMSRLPELLDTLFAAPGRAHGPYGRLFVVSAFGGITDLLLEHKKSGKPGVYALFASAEGDHGWSEALTGVARAMNAAHDAVLAHEADRAEAAALVRDRVEGARACLTDLRRLCSYGHFRLSEHLLSIRELLSALGESHSAFVAALALRRHGLAARCVDLSGWRDDAGPDLDTRLRTGLADIDIASEMPIVTGYAQCREGLMREFDRGYSEVTFSRIAALTGPAEAIIHKEFHLSSADPRLVGARAVRILGHSNYDVADQLANMGMEAIHPTAAKTLRRAAVPLRVTNAFDPGHPGTLIDDTPAGTPAAEIVTGLDLHALEVFEQDMVGVKGYDATILEVLKRHDVRIVSKSSNANTITHFLEAPLKALRRVERDIEARFASAEVTVRALSLVSVIGRDLSGLKVLSRGLGALTAEGIDVLAAQQTTRRVDVQFVVARPDREAAVKALHRAVIGGPTAAASPRRAA